ncbi:MAG: hypothetical protein M1402_02640 [Candidatus Thermoplasmatota archaeon]|nr:hypothetical protein [Candidatus Thermoplasmatota archaeon]MCL5665756.1 hypothetical protein [Candidatus Thermoplasmatota archaeon]
MNGRQRKIVIYILIAYAVIFFLIFVVFPIIALSYPSTGKYFGYFPLVFFFPFFWGFGRRNQGQTGQNTSSGSGDQNSYDNETATKYGNEFVMGQVSSDESSPWRYMKYVTLVLVVALAVAVYFALR